MLARSTHFTHSNPHALVKAMQECLEFDTLADDACLPVCSPAARVQCNSRCALSVDCLPNDQINLPAHFKHACIFHRTFTGHSPQCTTQVTRQARMAAKGNHSRVGGHMLTSTQIHLALTTTTLALQFLIQLILPVHLCIHFTNN